MIFVSYSLDRAKQRELADLRQDFLPDATSSATIICHDEATAVFFEDGLLRIKGSDTDLEQAAVQAVTVIRVS